MSILEDARLLGNPVNTSGFFFTKMIALWVQEAETVQIRQTMALLISSETLD